MKLWWKLSLFAVGLAVLASAGALAWAWGENQPLPGSGSVQFQIGQGDTLALAAKKLEEAQLIRSAFLFKVVGQLRGNSKSIPTGTFLVPRGLSVLDAVTWFEQAVPMQIRITIPEGLTSTKIAKLLQEKNIVSADEFLAYVRKASLEGTLFPDTYLFPLNAKASEVADKMVSTYEEKTAELRKGLSDDAVQKTLVMASVIEREYRLPEEAPLISSVFWNRYNRGIALASCATIEYILTEIQGRPHPKRIFFVHTQIPSPFNTYLNKGLPPAPICNPGLTALSAAFHPATTKYLYFVVADPAKGSHQFSSSYDDHEKARELYLNSYVSKS